MSSRWRGPVEKPVLVTARGAVDVGVLGGLGVRVPVGKLHREAQPEDHRRRDGLGWAKYRR